MRAIIPLTAKKYFIIDSLMRVAREIFLLKPDEFSLGVVVESETIFSVSAVLDLSLVKIFLFTDHDS